MSYHTSNIIMSHEGVRRKCFANSGFVSSRLILLMLVSLVAVDFIHGFNVDVHSPIIYYNADNGSQFGFSLALHRHNQENMLLVGAPKAQSSAFSDSQGVDRSGALFKCPIDTSSTTSPDCEEIIVDRIGSGHDLETIGQYDYRTNASGQWLGSTLESGGPNGLVVVCRPLFTRIRIERANNDNEWRDYRGGCFITNDVFSTSTSFDPCHPLDTSNWRAFYLMNRCEFGTSAAVKDDKIMYGATGSVLWNGRIWYTDGTPNADSVNKYFKTNSYPYSGTVYYHGYAVAFGDFTEANGLEYVISAPRYNNGYGRVFLHEYDASRGTLNSNYMSLSDGDLGSYFGHALVVSDLDNDGSDDLVVSAPLYTDPDRNVESAWDVGKIFVYYNNKQGGFMENPDIATGTDPGCRFGYSLAALGDINQDGFNDLAVGAPFCGGGSDGKVYIYHGVGTNRPINLSPKQILSPSSINRAFSYFGFSLSAGLDIDGNSYPDLAVGAHQSQNAIIFRSRAVVTAMAEMYSSQSAIDLDIKNDVATGGTRVTGFDVEVCFTYSGTALPNTLDFLYQITLDSTRQVQSRRAMFTDGGGTSGSFQWQATLNVRTCTSHRAFIVPTILDKQTAVSMLLSYQLYMTSEALPPILSESTSTQVRNSVGFLRECANVTCFPDLSVSATADVPYLILGVPRSIYLDILVANNGEDAFLSVFTIQEPEGINFVSMDRMASGSFATCSYSETSRVRICDIGNPIPASESVTLGLHYQSEQYSTFENDLVINMTARSVDAELSGDMSDNEASVNIPVYATANLTLSGTALPDRVILKEIDYPTGRNLSVEANIGPQITHNVTLLNKGPSFIGATTIEILWPMRVERGQIIMNVTRVAVETGARCSISSRAAPENISPTTATLDVNNTESVFRADCDSLSECWVLTCPVSSIAPGDTALVTITTLVVADVALNTTLDEIDVTSTTSVNVEGNIYGPGIQYSPQPTVQPFQITTVITMQYQTPTIVVIKPTPLWVYLVSALGGVIILIAMILLLYKLGFFKRKQLSPEQQQFVHERRSTMRKRAETDEITLTEEEVIGGEKEGGDGGEE